LQLGFKEYAGPVTWLNSFISTNTGSGLLSWDEILGEYLRFDEHDCNDPNNPDYGWKWWKHTHFKPLTQQQVEEHYEKVGQGVKEWFDTLLA